MHRMLTKYLATFSLATALSEVHATVAARAVPGLWPQVYASSPACWRVDVKAYLPSCESRVALIPVQDTVRNTVGQAWREWL
jgi:hypothetical protein